MMTPERLAEIRRTTTATVREKRELLAEVDRMQEREHEHALANGGCVPGDAYRDLADSLNAERADAWDEGYEKGWQDGSIDCTTPWDNPHRPFGVNE